MDLFPFTLVTVRNATKRCSCVVFSCFSTLTRSPHTRPCGVCEGNYPGENSFWIRGFFVDIRHILSSHGNHNLNQFPLEILHQIFSLSIHYTIPCKLFANYSLYISKRLMKKQSQKNLIKNSVLKCVICLRARAIV